MAGLLHFSNIFSSVYGECVVKIALFEIKSITISTTSLKLQLKCKQCLCCLCIGSTFFSTLCRQFTEILYIHRQCIIQKPHNIFHGKITGLPTVLYYILCTNPFICKFPSVVSILLFTKKKKFNMIINRQKLFIVYFLFFFFFGAFMQYEEMGGNNQNQKTF